MYRFYARRYSIPRNSYDNVAGWMGGWLGRSLAVTFSYYMKTAKPIRKLFSTILKPHHYSLLTHVRRYKILQRRHKIHAEVGKLVIFMPFWWTWSFISETVLDTPTATMER